VGSQQGRAVRACAASSVIISEIAETFRGTAQTGFGGEAGESDGDFFFFASLDESLSGIKGSSLLRFYD
jgi:hypothetical protein